MAALEGSCGVSHEEMQLCEKLERLKELKKKVEDLRRTKQELEQHLHCFHSDPFTAQLLKDVSVDAVSAINLPPELQKELVLNATKLDRIKQLEYELMAYRCTGITLTVPVEGKLKVCYDTCYKGEFFETYFLQLNTEDEHLKVSSHTLPFFVPLTKLLYSYNQQKFKFVDLLHTIHAYLTAFVRRRQQAEDVMQQHSNLLTENVSSLKAFDFIQLTLSLPNSSEQPTLLVLHLLYKDLTSALPSKVRCSDPGTLGIARSNIKKLFMSNEPAQALHMLLKLQQV